MAIMTKHQRSLAPAAPHVTTRRVRDDLWRVTSASGITLGYIAAVDRTAARPYEARRLLSGSTTVVPIGTGWSLDDALACFTRP